MSHMRQRPRMQCHSFFVFAVLLFGFGTFLSDQEQRPLTRTDLLRPTSAARAASDLTLSEKSHGGKSRLAAGAAASVPAAARPGISAALGRDDLRYQVQAVPGGFRAENPQQGLRAEFTAEGIEVRGGTAQWGLALRGYGYGDALQAASAAAPQANANRVEYRRGALTEWYVNGPVGLEQGFTLAERPGQSNGKPLTIALELSKELSASVDPGGKGLTLAQHDGRARLRYAGLVAYDAIGRELPSWAEVQGEDLLLHVDDAGAPYPLVVDPFVQLAKLTASDGAPLDSLGWSVGISGDGGTLVAGAPAAMVGSNLLQGAAYVFVKPGTGWASTSTFAAKLTASDGAAGDRFGVHVSVSGDGGTLVAGAYFAQIGSNTQQGAAYVFLKPGTGWATTSTFNAKLTASDGATGDLFGNSVSISVDGGTVAAGAVNAKIGSNTGQGAAYVFVKPGTGWATETETAKLTASDGAAGDGFGCPVAISGDGSTVVAGAPDTTVGSNVRQGVAYVFVKPGAGWATETETAKLTASDGAATDLLTFGIGAGAAISADGGTVVAGAGFATIDSNTEQGAAYVFVKPGTGWATGTSTAKLTASDGAAADELGVSVAISGDGSTVVAGADDNATGFPTRQGAAYVFVKPGTGWATTSTFDAKLTASDGAAGDLFGFSVSISADGGTVAAGAPVATIGSNTQQGAAYVFGRITAPSITTNPSDATVCAGKTASFSAAATGVPTPTVQWQVSTNGGATFTDLAGQASTTLTFTAAASQDGNQYRAVFTNVGGSATTTAATLMVNTAPAVTTNPSNQTVNSGSTATFTSAASGSPAPSVQWQVSTDGGATFTDLAGANSTTLTFTAATSQNGNQYRAVFTNKCGTARTTAATLTVEDFSVSVTPASETIPIGHKAHYTVTVTPINGFTGTVSLSCTGGPATATCSDSPLSVTINGSSQTASVTISIQKNSDTKGTFTFTLTGNLGTLSHSTTVSLTVKS